MACADWKVRFRFCGLQMTIKRGWSVLLSLSHLVNIMSSDSNSEPILCSSLTMLGGNNLSCSTMVFLHIGSTLVCPILRVLFFFFTFFDVIAFYSLILFLYVLLFILFKITFEYIAMISFFKVFLHLLWPLPLIMVCIWGVPPQADVWDNARIFKGKMMRLWEL